MKSIDEKMAEDKQYHDEMDRLLSYYEKAIAEAETDEDRETLRRRAISAFNNASYARYDRAKR